MPDAPAPAPEPVYAAPVSGASELHQSLEPQAGPDDATEPSLLAEATSHAVLEAFGRLAASRRTDRDAFIQDIVGELLRPMLKTWLDDNLPGLVERLVQTEIERLHGGR
jgi:cell pole-organizing protein PopZ